MRLLIVNADDLGWSVEVNAGVIEAHTGGVVTSATLMPTMPGAEDAAARVKDCRGLGVGVHLTLTAGHPVSRDRGVRRKLAPGGTFPASAAGLLMRARTSPRWRRAARSELAAQIQWMRDHGLPPGHIDSHKHFHVVEPFAGMVAELAARFGIRLIRNTREARIRLPGRTTWAARARRRLLAYWGAGAAERFADAGLVQPEAFFGIADTGRADPDRLRAFLEACPAESVEWMVHPGGHEAAPTARTRLTASRADEKKMLTRPELRDMITSCGFQLVSYGALL